MDMAKRAEAFREAVAKLGPRGRTTPYPKNLREEALEYARDRRGEGAAVAEVARELGIGVDSLKTCDCCASRRGSRFCLSWCSSVPQGSAAIHSSRRPRIPHGT